MATTQVACRKCGQKYRSDPDSLYTVCATCRQPESSQVRAGVLARSYEGEDDPEGVQSLLVMKVAIACAVISPFVAIVLARMS